MPKDNDYDRPFWFSFTRKTWNVVSTLEQKEYNTEKEKEQLWSFIHPNVCYDSINYSKFMARYREWNKGRKHEFVLPFSTQGLQLFHHSPAPCLGLSLRLSPSFSSHFLLLATKDSRSWPN